MAGNRLANPFFTTDMLHGIGISILGLLLIAAGLAIPIWSLYHRTQIRTSDAGILDGALRPEMIRLPNSRMFVAEHPVTQGNYYRVMQGMPRDVAIVGRSEGIDCPARFEPETMDTMPVTCVTPALAIDYAGKLTEIENAMLVRTGRTLLTPCYQTPNTTLPDAGCTGYRLATVSEWLFAAGIGANSTTPPMECAATGAVCPSAHMPKQIKQREHSRWYLYDLEGNLDEMAIADRATGRVGILGASTRTEQAPIPQYVDFRIPSLAVGFRIVRLEPPQ